MALRGPAFLIWLPAVVAAALCAGACTDRPSAPRIGYAVASGSGARDVAMLAGQMIGQRDALRGLDILRVSPKLGQSTYTGEVAIAEAIVADPGVVGAVGHMSSRSTLIAAPLYNEAGIPLVVPTSTSRKLREAGPWIFPMAPDDEAEGEFLVEFVVQSLGARRVTVFYLTADEYGLGLRDGVVAALRRRGLTAVDVAPVLADSNFTKLVGASLDRAVPDAVVVAGRSREAFGVIKALHERISGLPCVTGDAALLSAADVSARGASAPAVYAAAFWHPDLPGDQSRAFAVRCRTVAKFVPQGGDAMFYDGLMLLAQAVQEVGPSRPAVRRYLESLGSSRPPYQGITGPISFRPDRRVNLVMTRGTTAGTSIIVGHR
jgi:branched-chain amino acid transport system substrate-binding protein